MSGTKVNLSYQPVDGGLFGVHWLRVAVVQAVGAVVVRHHGHFAQFHAVLNSWHVGAERGWGEHEREVGGRTRGGWILGLKGEDCQVR